jgi:hypothetical protein
MDYLAFQPKAGKSMKHPTPSDFVVNVQESHVSVIFKPSDSYYSFGRLADHRGHCASWSAVAIPECETRKNWRHRRLPIGRGRADGAHLGCQSGHKSIAVGDNHKDDLQKSEQGARLVLRTDRRILPTQESIH